MTILAFIAGVIVGGLIVRYASQRKLREYEHEARVSSHRLADMSQRLGEAVDGASAQEGESDG